MTGTRIIDMPDLGEVTDGASFVGELAGSGRFSAVELLAYVQTGGGGAPSIALAAEIAARIAADILLAPIDSPGFTGTPTVPTQGPADHSTQAVNSTWVANFLAAAGYVPTGVSPVTSVASRTGAVVLTSADLADFATAARAALMTGLSLAVATAVVATDSELTAIGKLQAQITALTTRVAAIEANYVKTD